MPLKIPPQRGELTANVLTGCFQPRLDHTIELYDNTLREGEQVPGIVLGPDQKLEIARALDDFGVHWANVGFPAVSRQERASVERIARAGLRMKIAAMARLRTDDIDITVDSGAQLVSLFLPGSDSHLRDKLQLEVDEGLERIARLVSYCKGRGVVTSFLVEDASRTPLPRLLRMFQVAADAGADYLVVADTVGVLTPTATHRAIAFLRALLPRPIGMHFHDDLGLALANSLAGLEAGAQLVHVTINGVGERAGNTCLEELAVVLKVKYGRDFGFRLDRLDALSRRVHELCGTRAAEHKPITGKWCFTHESGIHVAGLLANPETYQPFPPELVGRRHEIAFGKHSGVAGIEQLGRQEGTPLTSDQARAVLDRVKRTAEARQAVTEAELLRWMREAAG
jgi:isopropylmalate/homocitrate/citramalate synthase